MTGKAYYITTLADWQRHAPRFANSHFIILTAPSDACHSERSPALSSSRGVSAARSEGLPGRRLVEPGRSVVEESLLDVTEGDHSPSILVLIEADEGVHLSLDDDPAFEPLPHPLAQKPIPVAAQSALAPHGVASGATTFDAAEALARVHPLLRHRVF